MIGLLNVSGCTYTPARPEEMAIKLCVRAAINLVAVDSEGELLEQAELEQVTRLWMLADCNAAVLVVLTEQCVCVLLPTERCVCYAALVLTERCVCVVVLTERCLLCSCGVWSKRPQWALTDGCAPRISPCCQSAGRRRQRC